MTDRIDAFLVEATGAARYDADAGASDGAATRLRLRESLARRGALRKRRITIIAAILASLFGSTAFAFIAGWRPLSRETSAVSAPVVTVTEPAASPRGDRTGAAHPHVTPIEAEKLVEPAPIEQAAPVIEAAPARIEPPTRLESPVTSPKREHAVAPTLTVSIEPAAPDPRSEELAAYRVAHEAHFRGTDPAAALAAWDAYLARFPTGQLAPEARFDRALVLVKLARFDDARTALEPFANAPTGAYRQAEATKLLEALPRQGNARH